MAKKLHDGSLYHLIAQNTSDLICIHGKDLSILYATPSSERVLGYSPTELVGRRLTDFLDEDFKNDVDVDTLNLFMSRPGGRVRVRVTKKDGSRNWMNIAFSELVESIEGHLLLTTTTDITESVNLLDDLMVALAKEKELSDLRANLFAIASHEFKTPLAVIQSQVELLERKTKGVPNVDKGLKSIQFQVDRLLELIGDILKLKELELGQNPYHPVKVDLANLVKRIWQEEVQTVYKQFKLELDERGEHITTIADEQMLRYVFSNLLSNACKFSGKKGTVRVEMNYQLDSIGVSIIDYGMGIPDAEKASIFQPFYRASNARNTSGSGVGLAIIKEFVALHNGQISVESELGKGTTFLLKFPSGSAKSLTQ